MSAWIVGNESINNIVNSLYWLKDNNYFKRELKEKFNIDLEQNNDEDLNKELQKFGQLLVNLNRESVNQRYTEKEEPFKFVFSDRASLNIFQFLMSIQCLIYQSCEGDCDKREEFKFLEEIKHTLQNKIISDIPEYQKAKWE